jgi:4-amino-4-deoxy-L-arabinose transferase-like glycosyltransferase
VTPSRRAACIVGSALALALALRLAFALGYWVGKPLTGDEREYLSLARSLSQGKGFVYDRDVLDQPVEPVGRAPGYPVVLAVTGGGRQPASSVPTSVKVVQSVVGALGVVLIGVLARRLAGPRAGAVATWIAVFYPPLVWISSYALSEVIVWPMALAIAWWFGEGAWAECRKLWLTGLGCGAATGAAVLVHPSMIVFLLIASLWLVLRRRMAPATVFVLGALLVIAPWTVRNYRHYGRVVVVASEGGVTFWTGNNPLARGEGDLAANPEIGRAKQLLRARHAELPPEQMESVYYREALAWIGAHPIQWAWLEVRKAFFLVVPIGPSYRLHSARYYGATLVAYGLVLPVAVVGWVRLRSRRARLPGLWLLAASSALAALAFFPQERFRIPLIDPALIVCAGAAFADDANADS